MGDWEKHYDETVGDNKPFFVNLVTGQSVWMLPDECRFFLSPTLDAVLQRQFTDAERAAIKQQFVKFDTDSDGTLTPEELRVLLTALGEPPMSVDDFDALFRELDVDGSGGADFDEYCLLVSGEGRWARVGEGEGG